MLLCDVVMDKLCVVECE